LETAEEIAAKAAGEVGKATEKAEDDKGNGAEHTPDPMEAAARADGWLPKEEYKGDPEKWVDQKTWVEKGPLLKRISSQSTHIKELKRTVDAMARHLEASVQAGVKQELAKLNEAKREAVKEGDVEKVEAIDKKIDQAKATKADIPTAKEVAPEIETWITANPWYKDDPEMHDFARAFNDTYFKRHPNGDLGDSLKATTAAVKKAFPEKFADAKKDPPAKHNASAVEGSTSPSRPGGQKYGVSRLTAGQKLAHDQYIKAGTFKKAAEAAKMSESEYYVHQLDTIGELTR
jgi:hypothetical protein